MDERTAWDIYFATLVGWQFHPGSRRDGSVPLTVPECAEIADLMLAVRRAKWDGEQ